MKFTFMPVAVDAGVSPILISGNESLELNGREYLLAEDENEAPAIYEIRYEYQCSPFKEALVVDNLIAVGCQEHFYLFDSANNESILALKVDGYFGHLYFDNDQFYVADCCGLYCIDKTGAIAWHNGNLAVDGVIISDFTEAEISGQAELDPPGGWEDFVLDRRTGQRIS